MRGNSLYGIIGLIITIVIVAFLLRLLGVIEHARAGRPGHRRGDEATGPVQQRTGPVARSGTSTGAHRSVR